MANWCSDCSRKPYIGCDPECPIFGKHLDEVAEMYFELQAEPVKHGRWEKSEDGDGAVCSHCKEDFCNIIHETDRFKRCPNCGARMDLEEER